MPFDIFCMPSVKGHVDGLDALAAFLAEQEAW